MNSAVSYFLNESVQTTSRNEKPLQRFGNKKATGFHQWLYVSQ